MMPQTKGDAPNFLQENNEVWGREYAEKRAKNPSASFQWKSYQSTLLIPIHAKISRISVS